MSSSSFFLTNQFLLQSDLAEKLYFDYAAPQPIIDYHSHLSPMEVATNRRFENMTRIWLSEDHYKWRAMRAVGISEEAITGSASDEDKFRAWGQNSSPDDSKSAISLDLSRAKEYVWHHALPESGIGRRDL